MSKFELGLGKKTVSVTLPEEKISKVIEGRPYPSITDVAAAVQESLQNPIGAPPLQQVVQAGEKVAVMVSGITRAWIK